MANRKLIVEVVGDTSSLERALGRAGKQTDTFGTKLKGLGKTAGIALGAAGVAGAVATLKVGWDELAESQKVAAQTEAVLKSTGSAAKVTQRQVEGLASSLSRMSGVDDEAIQAGENLLLTFTRIRNEAGKGNDVFDQATKATLNLSVAMGKDMSSSAILVGKALNDPIKGMNAMTRAGIQFTDAQKEQIKALVASGDTLGAQKIILKELETQFGGSAKAAGETLPGQMNKAKLAFEETSAKIVEKLLPAITKILEGFLGLITWLDENPPAVIWGRFVDGTKTKFEEIKTAIKERIDAAVTFITNLPGRMWSGFVSTWEENFYNPIKDKFNALKDFIGTVVSAYVDFYAKLPGRIWAAFVATWAATRDAIQGVFTALKDWMGFGEDGLLGKIVGFWQDLPGKIGAAIRAGAGALKDAVVDLFGSLPGWAKSILGISSPSKVFEEIGRNVVQGFIQGIQGQAGALKDKALDMASRAVDAVGAATGFPASGARLNGLVAQVVNALQYARSRGWGGTVTSGFRTFEEQAALWQRYVNSGFDQRYIAARPGTSSHESGQAVDVTDYDKFRRIMANAPANARLYSRVPGDPVHFSVSGFAEGGIVRKPTFALIGEAGPEAVVPLTGRNAGMQPIVVNVYPQGHVITDVDIGRTVRDELAALTRRGYALP